MARPRRPATTARSSSVSLSGISATAKPRAARSAPTCGSGNLDSTMPATGSNRSARFANPGCPLDRPVVRSTTTPAGWEPATARHKLVLPIPGGPVITAAAALPPASIDSAFWHAASSANRPNSLTKRA